MIKRETVERLVVVRGNTMVVRSLVEAKQGHGFVFLSK